MYENINHFMNSAAKVIITCVKSSAYHWHYDYELIVVLKGEIEVLYGRHNSESHKLAAGDIILSNPKEGHRIYGVDLDNICLCIQFPAVLFEPTPYGMKYHFFLDSTDSELTPQLPYCHYVEIAAKICLEHRKDSIDSDLRKNAWLYMLLADLLEGVQHELRSISLNNEKDIELVMSISSYVDNNLTLENLPNEVYKFFGLSEKGMYRLLKEVVGLTLKEIIDVARIERACILLQDSSIPLQVVSDECGYWGGMATFYRRFKHAMGITPGEYRKGVKTSTTSSNDIQDYLSFNEQEVDSLLRYWAGLEE